MSIDFFLHIPKCGGSSIRTLLAQNYAPERTIGFSGDWKAILWFRCLSTEAKLQYSIVHGHFPWNMHYQMQDGFRYFTFLRDPVDRHFSDYFYQRRWPDSPLHQSIVGGQLTLKDWAQVFPSSPRLRNYLVRYVVDDLFSDKVPPSYSPFGFERIRNEFAAFGLVERFNESVLLIARALGWKNVVYERRNVSEQKDEVPSELRSRVAEQIPIDVDFYARCVALFEERVHAAGSLFQEAAAELTELTSAIDNDTRAHKRFVIGEDQLELPLHTAGLVAQSGAIKRWLAGE